MTAKHFIPFFLESYNTIKMMHWFTTSYAEHVALDKLADTFQSLTDKFVEVYIGKHGRSASTPPRKDVTSSMAIATSANKLSTFLDQCVRYCTSDLNRFITAKDLDLANIRDELVASLNQTKYLIALR